MRTVGPPASAETAVPTMNTDVAAVITGRRPKRSASRPLVGAVRAAPSSAADTTSPWTQADSP